MHAVVPHLCEHEGRALTVGGPEERRAHCPVPVGRPAGCGRVPGNEDRANANSHGDTSDSPTSWPSAQQRAADVRTGVDRLADLEERALHAVARRGCRLTPACTGSSGPSSNVSATRRCERSPWVMTWPNHCTVGSLAPTHATSPTASSAVDRRRARRRSRPSSACSLAQPRIETTPTATAMIAAHHSAAMRPPISARPANSTRAGDDTAADRRRSSRLDVGHSDADAEAEHRGDRDRDHAAQRDREQHARDATAIDADGHERSAPYDEAPARADSAATTSDAIVTRPR